MNKIIILGLWISFSGTSQAQTPEINFQQKTYSSIVVIGGGVHEYGIPETQDGQQQKQQQCQQGSGCHNPTMYVQCAHPDTNVQQQQQCQQHQDGTPCSEDIEVELKYNETIQINRTLYVCLETMPQQQIQQPQQTNQQ